MATTGHQEFCGGGSRGGEKKSACSDNPGPNCRRCPNLCAATDRADHGSAAYHNDRDAAPGSPLSGAKKKVVPCFTPGTLIATPAGSRPVEKLRAGDRIVTRDNGLQEICWIGAKELSWEALRANMQLKPVLFRKGSLGENLPDRDLMVSPNHRMLVANESTGPCYQERDVLAAAKHLVENRGIHPVEALGVTYIHFMFERHELVLANGVWTESYQPGAPTLQGIGKAQRDEIFAVFPELRTAAGIANYGTVRRSLSAIEAKLLFPRR